MDNDSISRRAAIDALRTMQTYKLSAGDDLLLIDQAEAMTEIMLLPPAQPELIRCKDCLYHTENGYCHNANCYGVFTKNEHYCGYAKRKEGEQDG